MFHRYLVSCPQFTCDWSGRLIPNREADASTSFKPTGAIVSFECPCCLREWHARIRGSEAETLPFYDAEEFQEHEIWPPIEIGVGD